MRESRSATLSSEPAVVNGPAICIYSCCLSSDFRLVQKARCRTARRRALCLVGDL